MKFWVQATDYFDDVTLSEMFRDVQYVITTTEPHGTGGMWRFGRWVDVYGPFASTEEALEAVEELAGERGYRTWEFSPYEDSYDDPDLDVIAVYWRGKFPRGTQQSALEYLLEQPYGMIEDLEEEFYGLDLPQVPREGNEKVWNAFAEGLAEVVADIATELECDCDMTWETDMVCELFLEEWDTEIQRRLEE